MTKGNWGRVKAFFDLKTDGITIKGFKLVESNEEGHFIGNPNYKGNDGEYHDAVFVEKETRIDILKLAEEKYFDTHPVEQNKSNPAKKKEIVDEEIPF